LIRVKEAPEPAEFGATVREPGNRAILELLGCKSLPPRSGRPRVPLPVGVALTSAHLETHAPYWRKALDALYEAYGGICAYVAVRIPRVVGTPTVDHFVPRTAQLGLAYEWSNLRLASGTMNTRKREFTDMLDPFAVEDGWFVLNLMDCGVSPARGLDAPLRVQVEATIKRLGLDDEACRQVRAEAYDRYLSGDVNLEQLRRESPFVAAEVERQGMQRPGL